MKQDWEIAEFEKCLEKVTYTNKIQRKDFKEDGIYPIVSQEKDFINGYWDNEEDLFKVDKPVVIFGDHTQVIKFIDFDFVLGADGVKILKPKDKINSKYFYYFLQNVDLGSLGYARHYRLLKEINVAYPKSLPEQQRIVAILDETFSAIDKAKANAEQNLKNAKELFESYLNSIKADKVDLGSLVDIKTGKLNANAAVENGEYPFFTCSREVYAIDKYAFDLEAILLAGNNASGDFNVKHYKGKFNAYQRTYVITVNEKQKVLYRYLYFQLLKSLKEFKEMSVGANTRFLKLGMIQGLKIALPTIEEQQTIVRQLDALRAETQKLEAVYQKKIADLEELKKSILQKAFAGELRSPEGVASANDGYSPSEKKTKNKISPERA